MKMVVFWNIVPCSVVETDCNFRDTLLPQSSWRRVMMEGGCTMKRRSVFYETARRNVPENSHLYTRRRQNVKWRFVFSLLGEYELTYSLQSSAEFLKNTLREASCEHYVLCLGSVMGSPRMEGKDVLSIFPRVLLTKHQRSIYVQGWHQKLNKGYI